MLTVERVMFGEHLDVTSYTNGQRETHNPEGRAIRSVVWDLYQSGCSIRMLNPQSFHLKMCHLLSNLQEFFGSFVGANIYLTPPGTQGFAPHYDDIEAFILQVEGSKRWRVYPPHKIQNQLPRVSSRNFGQKGLGKPVLDVLLEAGDMLYFPRGFIHQGNTVEGKHSLHVTISTYQKTCWADLFAKMLAPALEKAAREDVEFRRGLPFNYLRYMGCSKQSGLESASAEVKEQRVTMEDHARSLLVRLSKHLPLDAGCDDMALDVVRDSLPPSLTEVESYHSAQDGGERWDPQFEQVVDVCEVEPESRVRLARFSALRLVALDAAAAATPDEDGTLPAAHRLYHALNNTRIYHQVEPTYLDIEPECLDAINMLMRSYPDFVAVEELPVVDIETKMQIVRSLYDRGLLVTEEPLSVAYPEDGNYSTATDQSDQSDQSDQGDQGDQGDGNDSGDSFDGDAVNGAQAVAADDDDEEEEDSELDAFVAAEEDSDEMSE